MKKTVVLLTTLIFISMFSYALDYNIESLEDIVYPGEKAIFKITISNEGSENANYSVLVNGYGRTSWVTVENSFIQLEPHQSKYTYLYIVPPLETDPGNYEFEITVKNEKNENETQVHKIAIYVKKTSKLQILNISTDKKIYNPGEEVKILYKIKNIGTYISSPLIITANISGYDAKINLQKHVEPIKIDELRRESLSFQLPKYAKGMYNIKASLYNQYYELLESKEFQINVNEITDIQYVQNIEKGILTKKIILSATNNGNTGGVAKIQYTMSGPEFQYYYDQDAYIKNGVIEWSCFLKPGEICTKTIKVNYWWIVLLITTIIILLFVLIRNYFKPQFHKKYSKEKEGYYHVHIYVKNKGRKPITDIEIHDRIPGILKFEPSKYGIRPFRINKRNQYTEVIWTLDELKPGEERVISYRLKPRLSVVGGIDLPKAKLKINTNKGSIILRETRKLTLR